MITRTFLKPQLMRFDFDNITDHNRSELSISHERIETSERMADGTLRKSVVATKKEFSCSWTDVPHTSEFTVDGFWGANELTDFYMDTPGPFWLNLVEGDGNLQSYFVVIEDFSCALKKRGLFDMYDVEISMVEV